MARAAVRTDFPRVTVLDTRRGAAEPPSPSSAPQPPEVVLDRRTAGA